MAFWSQNIEPKRQNRWYLRFANQSAAATPPAAASTAENLDAIVFALKSAEKPSYKINVVTHKFANHNFKYPGRLEWNTIPLKFASVTQPDAAKIIYGIFTGAGYKAPTEIFINGRIDYSFLQKGKEGGQAADKGFVPKISPGGVELVQVNADGTAIETWRIHSPMFMDAKFGALDYGNDNIIDIECTMRYDWAEFVTAGSTTAIPNQSG